MGKRQVVHLTAVMMGISFGWTIGIEDASAQDAVKEQAEADEAEHARIGLGLSLPNVTGAAGNIGGGAGVLGALAPRGTASVEIHAAGPLWVSLGLTGAYSETEIEDVEGQSGTLGGRAGLRIETPVFEWLEAGGYGFFEGRYSFFEGGEAPGTQANQVFVGGDAGVAAHLRPTRFFGVRLGLEILRVGHSWANDRGENRSFQVELTAAPSVEVTFTF
jgi:hypothetical protein